MTEQNNLPNRATDESEEQSVESVPIYRRAKVAVPAVLIVLAASAVLWKWYVGTKDVVSTDDAFIDGNRVTISAKILGRITTLTVHEGDSVRTNQMLVLIDDADLRAQEAQANAALALAGENLKLAGVSLAKAQDDFRRADQQFRDNVIPKEQFDHAQNELEASRTRQSIASAQVATARAQVGVVEAQLKNTRIVAPMNGTVSKRWALVGDVVQPAQPILSVYSMDSVWVTANLEETKIAALKTGDPVTVEVDAYPSIPFSGRVLQLGTNTAAQFSLIPPNNASGNFTKVTQRVPVKISVVRDDGGTPVVLLPGMSVEVSIRIR